MSSEKLPPERRPPASAADAVERLARIVNAAEQAAASVIDDAEKEAHRYVAEAAARADRIVADRLRELADELDPPGSRAPDSRAPHSEAPGPGARASEAPDFGESRAPHLKPVEPAPAVEEELPAPQDPGSTGEEWLASRRSGSAGEGPPASRSASAGARLLATQMAVSGSSRTDIEAEMRGRFDIQDTREILDAILGPEE
jgi:hypothetical protein